VSARIAVLCGLAVCGLAVDGLAACGSGAGQGVPAGQPHWVHYSVAAAQGAPSGTIGIRYIDPNTHQVASVSVTRLDVPWTTEYEQNSTSSAGGLTAWVDVDNQTGVELRCAVSLDGKVIASRTITPHTNSACIVPDF